MQQKKINTKIVLVFPLNFIHASLEPYNEVFRNKKFLIQDVAKKICVYFEIPHCMAQVKHE